MQPRLALLLGLVFLSILVPFAFWGASMENTLSLIGTKNWLAQWGAWGWSAGVLLIVLDLFLPVPATVVMSALGLSYGWAWGGLGAALGSFLAGCIGYTLCHECGQGLAKRIAGEQGIQQAEQLFDKHGHWLVALSRCLPILPEAVACLAGAVRMPLGRYLLSLACGSLPVGFIFAAVGQLGAQNSSQALVLSMVLPVILWLIAKRFIRA